VHKRKESKFQIRQVKPRLIVISLLLFLPLPIWAGRQSLAQQDKGVALDGVWRLRGYGKILHIHQGNYTNYDITEISCVQESQGTLKDFRQRYGRLAINDSGQLTLSTIGGITRYTYDRLNALPSNVKMIAPRDQRIPNITLKSFTIYSKKIIPSSNSIASIGTGFIKPTVPG
jgi:hypothetical protein